MSNYYWPPSEFGVTVSGSDNKDKQEIEQQISATCDFIRKHVIGNANIEISVMIQDDIYATCGMINGICQFGIYDDKTNTITQNIKIGPQANMSLFKDVLADMREQAMYQLHSITHEPQAHVKIPIIEAWGQIYYQKRLINSADIWKISAHGYTSKDFLPYQRSVQNAMNVYFEKPRDNDPWDIQVYEAKITSSAYNIAMHIQKLSQGIDKIKDKLL